MKKLQETIQESQKINEAKGEVPFSGLKKGDTFYGWWYDRELSVYTFDHIEGDYIYGIREGSKEPSPLGKIFEPDELCSNSKSVKDENSFRFNHSGKEVFISCPAELERIAKVFMKYIDDQYKDSRRRYMDAVKQAKVDSK